MQTMKILFMIIVVVKLCSAALPNDGSFHFNSFTDSRCLVRTKNANSAVFPVTKSSCWVFSLSFSLKVKKYDTETYTLTFDIYGTPDCSGDKVLEGYELKADETCYEDGLNPGLYYNIGYVNISVKEKLKFITYSGAACNQEKSVILFNGENYCWKTSDSNSIVALNWNKETKDLQVRYFGNDNSCGDYADLATEVKTVKCDGSCLQDVTTKDYYSCAYDSSARLVFSMISALVLLLIFI
jgi:hypothetical protein